MDKKYYSVSRIENNVAVLEFPNGSFKNINIEFLPSNIKEGNLLFKDENNNFVVDDEAEKKRKEFLIKLQNKLF